MGDVLLIWYFILCNISFYSFNYRHHFHESTPQDSALSIHCQEGPDIYLSWKTLPLPIRQFFSPVPPHTWPSSAERTTSVGKLGMKLSEGWGSSLSFGLPWPQLGDKKRIVIITWDWHSNNQIERIITWDFITELKLLLPEGDQNDLKSDGVFT